MNEFPSYSLLNHVYNNAISMAVFTLKYYIYIYIYIVKGMACPILILGNEKGCEKNKVTILHMPYMIYR